LKASASTPSQATAFLIKASCIAARRSNILEAPAAASAHRHLASGIWHLDEMVISIQGRRLYLWRAVDSEGEILDILVQTKRNTAAALKLMRKLLKKQG
jgi:transposase-like protein